MRSVPDEKGNYFKTLVVQGWRTIQYEQAQCKLVDKLTMDCSVCRLHSMATVGIKAELFWEISKLQLTNTAQGKSKTKTNNCLFEFS